MERVYAWLAIAMVGQSVLARWCHCALSRCRYWKFTRPLYPWWLRTAPAVPFPLRSTRVRLFHLAHTDVEPAATQQALIRDVFGLFAHNGMFLVWTPIPEYKALFTSLGFRLLPDTRHWFWGDEQPGEGYILDLTRMGVEPWIEAIVAGRQPPLALAPSEVEQELHEVLAHRYEDARLRASPLAAYFAASGAEELRTLVGEALRRLSTAAGAQAPLAARAHEHAYLTRSGSHERAAEELAVSRSTFYRLLRYGVRELAIALAAEHSA